MLADAQGDRVAAALLDATPGVGRGGRAYLVVGNGSARRSEKAPGHLDERAVAFDDALGARPARRRRGNERGRSTSAGRRADRDRHPRG